MNEMQTFYPWCVVAAFSDGSRLTFGGSTEEQARSAMEAASNEHGEISWWDRVTDTNYVDGQYYQLLPDQPTLHVVDLAGYDGPVDKNGFPVGLPEKIARYAVEHGAAEGEAQVVVKTSTHSRKLHEMEHFHG